MQTTRCGCPVCIRHLVGRKWRSLGGLSQSLPGNPGLSCVGKGGFTLRECAPASRRCRAGYWSTPASAAPAPRSSGSACRISSHRIVSCISARPVADAAMDAETERQMLARTRAVDDERRSGFSIASSSRLPDMYHMATLSPLRIVLPPSSVSSSAVRRMWITGVCQRMISGTMLVTSAGIVAQLAILVGILVQRQQAAGHRVARRVVAADDQQQQVAHELVRPRRQIARRLAVRQHRDQVGPRRLLRRARARAR